MTVPTRDEGSLESSHRFRFDDEILQHLVERCTHVDIAVGKGGTVVKDELRRSLASFLDRGVKPFLLPFLQQLRLTLGETSLHGEGGLGKSDSILVAGHDGKKKCLG